MQKNLLLCWISLISIYQIQLYSQSPIGMKKELVLKDYKELIPYAEKSDLKLMDLKSLLCRRYRLGGCEGMFFGHSTALFK